MWAVYLLIIWVSFAVGFGWSQLLESFRDKGKRKRLR